MTDDTSNTITPDPLHGSEGESPIAYRLVRGGVWVAASQYWTIAVGFGANIALTRLLSPEAFGSFALAMFFGQVLRIQPKLGIGSAFTQTAETSGRSVGTFTVMDLMAGLAGGALAFVAGPILLGLGYQKTVVGVAMALALALALESMVSTGGVLLDKQMNFRSVCLIHAVACPISYFPAFFLAIRGWGAWSLASQTLTFNLLSLLAVWWVVLRREPSLMKLRWSYDPDLARQFLRFGLTVGLWIFAASLLTQLDNFYIGTFAGLAALGFYDRAYRTAQWPTTLLSNLLSRTAFVSYSKLHNDPPRLEKTLTMVVWLISVFAVPLAVALFIAAPDLIVLLYGEAWLPSAPLLRILALLSIAFPFLTNAGRFFVAIGKPHIPTRLAVTQVLILGVLGMPFTLRWGATGMCAAVGLSLALGLVAAYHFTGREVPIRLGSILGAPAAAAAILIIVYVVLSRILDLNQIAGAPARVLFKSGFAFVGFYLLVFLIQGQATRQRLRYVFRLALAHDELPR